jgi:retinol-binding protein 3
MEIARSNNRILPTVNTILIGAVAAALGMLSAFPLAAQTTRPAARPLTATERTAVIDAVIGKVNEMYVFPDTATKISELLRGRMAAHEYDALTDGRDFARKLTADLRDVSRDRHLSVTFVAEGAREMSLATLSEPEKKAHREFLAKINFGFEKVERMQGNVGYLELHGFVPKELGAETASAAMSFVAHTDALIIDLRKNRGGEPAMVAFVLSYLFDEPTHVNDMHHRLGNRTESWWTERNVPGQRFGGSKPVLVLTSSNTFSGGEEFAYDLKCLKRATVIGETTKGGAHDSRPVKVGERFLMELPFARAVNPITHTNWEGKGVSPDVARPASEALEVAYRMALEKIIATTTNKRQREQLEGLLKK